LSSDEISVPDPVVVAKVTVEVAPVVALLTWNRPFAASQITVPEPASAV
jgi:hypothetical protein